METNQFAIDTLREALDGYDELIARMTVRRDSLRTHLNNILNPPPLPDYEHERAMGRA